MCHISCYWKDKSVISSHGSADASRVSHSCLVRITAAVALSV